MPILHTSIIFSYVANDEETLFFSTLYFSNGISKILFNSEKREHYFCIYIGEFTDFCDKLRKNLYDCNFTLNLVKKNDVKLPQKYGNFTRSEFYDISASLVSASTTSKISVYRISCKSIYFYYIALPYIGSVVLNF